MPVVIFNPTVTAAGLAAAMNADTTGIDLAITHVAFGTGAYDPTGAEPALVAEQKRVAIGGGSLVAPTQARILAIWSSAVDVCAISEVGFFAGDILFAVWSRATGGPIGYKTTGVDFVMFNDIKFDGIPAGSITVSIDSSGTPAALAAIIQHETAGDPHAQYELRDATLTALAALVTAANQMVYSTGADTFEMTGLSAFMRTLLDDADQATARATLGAASPADITNAINNLLGAVPGALDTLDELAAALGDDANFSVTMTNALAGKAALSGANFTGQVQVPAGLIIKSQGGVEGGEFHLQKPDSGSLLEGNLCIDLIGNTLRVFEYGGGEHGFLIDLMSCSTGIGSLLITNDNVATLSNKTFISAALTGTSTAPTAAFGTNTTQLANTAFVQAAVAAILDSTPDALNTLNELAAALGDDANFATNVNNALAQRVRKDASSELAAGVIIGALTNSNSGMPTIVGEHTYVVRGNGVGPALMTFHRPGVYASYFGLDTDNIWKVGGWSAGSVAYALLHEGNYTSYSPSLVGGGASGTWGIGITGNAATATKASTLALGGGDGLAMTFNWTGQVGQPTWLWGSDEGTTHQVYNPSNFNVNYATSAGTVTDNAITVAKLGTTEKKQIAKAWVNFDGTLSGTITPRASHNVSSVTKTTTGDYTVNFSVAMPDANYTPVGMSLFDRFIGIYSMSTTAVRVVNRNGGGTSYDSTTIAVAVFGN
jgi:hypothetical protein